MYSNRCTCTCTRQRFTCSSLYVLMVVLVRMQSRQQHKINNKLAWTRAMFPERTWVMVDGIYRYNFMEKIYTGIYNNRFEHLLPVQTVPVLGQVKKLSLSRGIRLYKLHSGHYKVTFWALQSFTARQRQQYRMSEYRYSMYYKFYYQDHIIPR